MTGGILGEDGGGGVQSLQTQVYDVNLTGVRSDNWATFWESVKVRYVLRGIVLLVPALYVVSYFVLSSFGAYAPEAFGLAGVKWYRWAPYGMFAPGSAEWRKPVWIFYGPLELADSWFWHTHTHPDDGDPYFRLKRSARGGAEAERMVYWYRRP